MVDHGDALVCDFDEDRLGIGDGAPNFRTQVQLWGSALSGSKGHQDLPGTDSPQWDAHLLEPVLRPVVTWCWPPLIDDHIQIR